MSSETAKMFDIRRREGFFQKYIQNLVIDIGSGPHGVSDECEKYDITLGNSDATYMEGVPDEHFDTVYSSHLLEHLELPVIALRNWWRILKTGGFLVVDVPSRKFYEKSQHLPSRWNSDHKHFFNPVHGEPPDTLGLLDTFEEAVGPRYELEHLRVFHDGCDNWMFPMEHSHGLYTVELCARKV